MYRRDFRRSGYEPKTEIPETKERAWTYAPKRRVFTNPVVASETVYVADPWSVHAVDRETGSEQWRYHVRDRTDFPCLAEGTPAVTDDGVIVGTCDGVHLLDAADGSARWTVGRVRDGHVHPVVVGDRAYLSANSRANPTLFAVGSADGSMESTFRPEANALTAPAVSSGRVYVAATGEFDDSGDTARVYALGTDGGVRWKHALDVGLAATPAVAEGTVYAGGGTRGGSGRVVALDAGSGREQWSFDASGVVETPVAVTPRAVYVGCDAGRLHALDPGTGRERWSFDLGARAATGPVAARNGVCVTSADGTLHALGHDGTELWSASLDTASFYAVPALAGNRVVAGGRSLVAFGDS